MKMHRLQNPSLIARTCALVIGMATAPLPAFAQSAPFTLTDSPVAAVAPSSPLMMSAAALDAVADAPAQGGNTAGADDGWHFRLAVPIWIPGMSGDMTVRGHELSGGSGEGDLASTLDFAATFHFEMEKGRWGAFVDTMYLALSDDKDLRTGGTADAKLKSFIGELGGFYTVFAPKAGEKGWGMFRADALAGVRVTWLQLEAETSRFDATRERTIVDARMELGLKQA